MKKCKLCGIEFESRNIYCSEQCLSIGRRNPEINVKRSISMKKYLKENPEKHVWKRNNKFKSAPCEFFKDFLKQKEIFFLEEWPVLENRFYSVDIAFPDLKIGIEINGNQHYDKFGNLLHYYKTRHDEIEKAGWKLHQIHYSQCYKPEEILNLVEIGKQPDYSEYFVIKENIRKEKEKNRPLKAGLKQKIKSDKKYAPIIELLKNSDINFQKFGWVKEAALVIGIVDQKVCNWMKRHMPEFYSDCYKRKSSRQDLESL